MQYHVKLRGRAWRRKQKFKPSHQAKINYQQQTTECWCLEKSWKLMYGRHEKLRRAKKLGFLYPRKYDDLVLLMCSE